MSIPAKAPLGPSTGNRKWYLAINEGTYGSPSWTYVYGIVEFKEINEPVKQKNSDFDSAYGSQNVTKLNWGIELKVERKTQADDPTVYDDGQELLRAAGKAVMSSNRLDIMYFEYQGSAGGPEVEAHRGYVCVSWNDDGGSDEADSVVSVMLDGQGDRTAITHPATAAAPTVYAVSPASGAAGDLVKITGLGFTGATDVDFDAIECTDYVIHDNHTIYAVAPDTGTGAEQVTVTNATGASTDEVYFTYTA